MHITAYAKRNKCFFFLISTSRYTLTCNPPLSDNVCQLYKTLTLYFHLAPAGVPDQISNYVQNAYNFVTSLPPYANCQI
uniref:Uncharacterized protein n=1 Tax=Pararge aegeria TaxID=116150 RepID=S4NWA7_9NEOP